MTEASGGGNASTGGAGGGDASTGGAGGAAPAPKSEGPGVGSGQASGSDGDQAAGGQSADTPSQGEAKGAAGADSASTETPQEDSPAGESSPSDGAAETGAEQGGEAQGPGTEQGGEAQAPSTEQGGEPHAPGAEETSTGEPATGPAGDAAAETAPTGEEPRGDVADAVLRDVPPPDPEPVSAASEAWHPVIGQAEQARDNGHGGAKELGAAWNDDGGAAMAGRSEVSLREADDVAQGARPVKELLDQTAGDFAHTRDQMVSSAVHAEGNARVAEALAGSEPEAHLAKARFKDSAVNGNLELRAAMDRKVRGDWENLTIPETATQPGQEHAAPDPAGTIPGTGQAAGPVDPGPPPPPAPGAGQAPPPDAATTVPEATQNLDNAQVALAEAGRIIANLPTPPSDADLLRDYQVGDDQMIEAFDKKVTLSEAVASLRSDDSLINPANPFFHYEIENEATTAGKQSFPDPDGPEGPLGGRDGTGDNHRDAFRHAYWNAAMARAFGEHSAEAVGTGHEMRPEDPVLGQPPQFAERQEAMDLYNNKIGRDIATALGPDASDEDVRGAIEQAIREGKLVVFNNEHTGLVSSGGIEDFPPAPAN